MFLQRLSFLPVLALLVLQAGCSDSAANSAEEAEYYHAAVGITLSLQHGYSVDRRFVGRISSRQRSDLGFEQAGKLVAIDVDEGALVQEGDVLARLDTKILHIAQDELQAQVAESNANLALVEANLKRVRSLKKDGYSSEQRLDELAAQRLGLLAGLDRLRASMAANATRIEKSDLMAPFDAVISRRFVDQGMVVNEGTPVLRLLQRGGKEARINVPARILGQLAEGQQLPVQVSGVPYQSQVLSLGADINATTQTAIVRVALPDSAAVVDGQLAHLQIQETVAEEGFWVPLTALTDGLRGLWNIYVLVPTDKSGVRRIESRNVEVLFATDKSAYITGSLENHSRVISAGLHRLVPGQLVRDIAEEVVRR